MSNLGNMLSLTKVFKWGGGLQTAYTHKLEGLLLFCCCFLVRARACVCEVVT